LNLFKFYDIKENIQKTNFILNWQGILHPVELPVQELPGYPDW